MEPEAIPLISQQHTSDGSHSDDGFTAKPEHELSSDDELVYGRTRLSSLSLQTILAGSALVVSLFSLLWNTFVFSTTLRAPSTVSSVVPLKHVDVGALRRPSIYLGLERMPAYRGGHNSHGQASPLAVIAGGNGDLGVPTALARVNSRYPDLTFTQDGWVFLTEDDRTLMSFSAPEAATAGDQCALLGRFPARSELGLESPVQMLTLERDDANASSSTASRWPEIHFTALGFTALSFPTVTYNTLPATRTPLGSITAAFGSNASTTPFACPSVGESFVVEAACGGGGCRVEYTYPDLSGGETVGTPGHEHPAVPLGVMLVKV